MAVPTTVTESELKSYLHGVLDTHISTFLSMTVAGGSYDTIVEDALLEYGTTDITDIDSIAKIKLLRACGRLWLWRKIVSATNSAHDTDNYEMMAKWSQLNKQARESVKDEESLVEELRPDVDGGSARCVIYEVRRHGNPFSARHHDETITTADVAADALEEAATEGYEDCEYSSQS